MAADCDIACYYFPNYHPDVRNGAVHGEGWTEWELVRRAEPRYPAHRQPRVPAWGYQDESDPAVMAGKIDAAADHGIDAFLFDWYWYDDGPFLQRALEEGFFGAANNRRLAFALMWANHDWMNIHPAKLHETPGVLYPGRVRPETFEQIVEYVVETCFAHPSYWRPGGCPYFSIYHLREFLAGFSGLGEAREALEAFRRRTRQAGHPDLHLNAVVWNLGVLPGEAFIRDASDLLEYLGFASTTSYVWVHHLRLPEFPFTSYRWAAERAAESWADLAGQFRLPYYPNVTVGWDASPRTVQSDRYLNTGYPFMPILSDAEPEAFAEALARARDFLADRPREHRVLTVNAWNEWTEGSVLEPDVESGMAYLEAIGRVFGA